MVWGDDILAARSEDGSLTCYTLTTTCSVSSTPTGATNIPTLIQPSAFSSPVTNHITSVTFATVEATTIGSYNISCTVSDGLLTSTPATDTIVVAHPVMTIATTSAPTIGAVGSTIPFTFYVTDSSTGMTITPTCTVTPATGVVTGATILSSVSPLTATSNGGNVSFNVILTAPISPYDIGIYTINFSATDGAGGSTTTPISNNISIYQPPQIYGVSSGESWRSSNIDAITNDGKPYYYAANDEGQYHLDAKVLCSGAVYPSGFSAHNYMLAYSTTSSGAITWSENSTQSYTPTSMLYGMSLYTSAGSNVTFTCSDLGNSRIPTVSVTASIAGAAGGTGSAWEHPLSISTADGTGGSSGNVDSNGTIVTNSTVSVHYGANLTGISCNLHAVSTSNPPSSSIYTYTLSAARGTISNCINNGVINNVLSGCIYTAPTHIAVALNDSNDIVLCHMNANTTNVIYNDYAVISLS